MHQIAKASWEEMTELNIPDNLVLPYVQEEILHRYQLEPGNGEEEH